MHEGSCQHVEAVPEEIRRVFVVSSDISAKEHVCMQAAMQTFVDNSLSKTINSRPEQQRMTLPELTCLPGK